MKKLTFWKSLFLLCALIVGSTSAWATDVVDQLNKSDFAATGTSYTNFSNVQKNTAVYAGRTSVQNSSVGMKRNSSDGAGIFTTTSGGVAKSLKFTWTSTSSRTLQVWGKNSAYSLANTKNQSNFGTKIAEVTYNSNNKTPTLTLNSTTEYEYILIVPSSSDMLSIKDIEITWEVEDNTKVKTPNITGAQNFLESTTVGISCDTDGAAIQYSTDNGNTWNTYTDEFNLTKTTTVKAKATKSGLTDSDESSATFTKRTPVTVTEALTAIAALDNNGTSADQCVRGIVSTAGSLSSGKISYYISVDGTTANQLYIFGGKGLNNANFTASTDIKVGDEVVVFGTYKKYVSGNTTTPEVTDGYLLSITKKTDPTFTISPDEAQELDAYSHETVDITLTTTTDGAVTCESSNNDVATVALKSAGVYTITAQAEGTATITIKSAMSSTYYAASKTIAVTVTDDRADAGISFTEDEVETTFGEEFTGQTLSNEHSLPVTYSSSDETVATVNASGTVEVLKAGTTTIKATFDGDATYKKAVASYTLTINKAAAGLSFSQTSFDFDLNDGNFTGVAVNNPNSLPVTYASNNEDVAVVIDESSYEILIDASVVGTATITASFTGNDNFNSGSASYTINVLDYSAKGGKYNPYTVAEVNNGTATGTAYVKGFIVGVFQGKDSNATTSGKSNVALSDDPAVISGANTIAVQLPSGTFRDAWNVDENYTIGAEIVVKGSIESYFTSKTGVKSPSEIIPLSVPGKVTSVGYATFSWPYDVDFSAHNALRVYYIDNTDGEKARMAEIASKVVPANTGVLLRGEADSYKGNVTTGATAITGNLLKANTKVKTASADREFYIFANGGNGLGFYPIANATKLGAGKAYIDANDVPAGAKNLVISFDGETTGIANLNVDETANFDANAPMYNLAGQRVTKSYKGVVIVNGKKMLNK